MYRWVGAVLGLTLGLGILAPRVALAQCEEVPPLLLNEVATPGLSWGAEAQGCHVYLADDFTGGIQVIDICVQPAAIVATIPTIGSPLDLAVSGPLLCVASGFAGVEIFDISNPSTPIPLGVAEAANFARSVAIAGNFIFIADGETFLDATGKLQGGVQVYRIIDPLDPTQDAEGTSPPPPPGGTAAPPRVGGLNPGVALGLDIAGDFLYVADGHVGLNIFRVFHKLPLPQQLPTFEIQLGQQILDPVAFPDRPGTGIPDLVFSLVGPNGAPEGVARDIAIAGTFAYVADGAAGLKVVDISSPLVPVVVGVAPTTPGPDVEGDARKVTILGGNAFVVDALGGLVVIDITNPLAPTEIARVLPDNLPVGHATDGDRAFVADLDLGLQDFQIFNIDLLSAAVRGAADTLGNASAVDVEGNFAYVADGVDGLKIFDISNPNAPVLVGQHATPERAVDIKVDGNFAYVVDWQPLNSFSGFQVFDISDPTNPVHISAVPGIAPTLVTQGDAMGLDVEGEFAYFADGFAGIGIVDISDPTAPFMFAIDLEAPDFSTGITVVNGFVYVANGFIGLRIVGLGGPNNPNVPLFFPVELSRLDTAGFASRVVLLGDIAYIADGSAGVQIVDVSNPALPTAIGTLVTGDFAADVDISGRQLFVADGAAGVQVFDITDPAAPVPAGTGPIDTPGDATGIRVDGDVAFVADDLTGLQIIELCGPVPARIRWVTPPPTTIVGGMDFTVEWELSNFTGTITENQAILDLGGPLEARSPVQLGQNGVFSHTFTTPVVTTPTTVQVVARALDDALEVLSPAEPVTIQTAGPPGPGITWVVPPPPTVEGGVPFTVQWELANFTGTITENQVTLTPAGGTPIVVAGQPAGCTLCSASLTGPEVTGPTNADVIATARDNGVLVLSPMLTTTLGPRPPPAITWVTEPPATASGGQAIPLTWNLADFVGTITENQVHFGISSVLRSSPVQPPANGNHNHTFNAPNVGTFDGATTFRFVAAARENGNLVLSPILASVVSPGPTPPTVRWLIAPPASAPGGGSFVVSWELQNFAAPATENMVVFGVTSIVGMTANQTGGNAVYSTTVNVPAVTVPGTLFYTAIGGNDIEFAFAPITGVNITVP